MAGGLAVLYRAISRRGAWYISFVGALLLSACASGVRIDNSYTSENQDSRALFLVLHYTVGNFESALAMLTKPSSRAVSSHYLVRDEPVKTYRLVDENRRAWHAGPSYWRGYNNLNASSIGIEIVNPGWVRDADGSQRYIPFSAAQIDEVVALCKDIVARHGIRPEHIIGHADIAPGRKQDPGPLFPWKRLADEGLIAWPDSSVVATRRPLHAAQLPGAAWFQEKLAEHGYNTSRSGEFDALTRDSLVSFQMKYRSARYDGLPDAETAALLDVVNSELGMVMTRPTTGTRPYTSRW
ncbi:N-acetylmuramoyl-L-alanine amidase [Rhodoferax sp.]|uniref:peptidoglycan recognition protein family protein n=1 Tax=Rhodoferax sp. TaxID=50421 RepID=UPI00277569F9|nr:N-acetylmuramoyl-L-alanine amidase [Rhodoferax sp.]